MNKSIFIAHAPDDKNIAAQLHQNLVSKGENSITCSFDIAYALPPDEKQQLATADFCVIIISPFATKSPFLPKIRMLAQDFEKTVICVLVQSLTEDVGDLLDQDYIWVDLRKKFMEPLDLDNVLNVAENKFRLFAEKSFLLDKNVPPSIQRLTGSMVIIGMIGAGVLMPISWNLISDIWQHSPPLQYFIPELFFPAYSFIALILLLGNLRLVIAAIRFYFRKPVDFLNTMKEYRSIHTTISLFVFPTFCCICLLTSVPMNTSVSQSNTLPTGLFWYALLSLGIVGAWGWLSLAQSTSTDKTIFSAWQVPDKISENKFSAITYRPALPPQEISILYDWHDRPFADALVNALENVGRTVYANKIFENSGYYILLFSRWSAHNLGQTGMWSDLLTNPEKMLLVDVGTRDYPAEACDCDKIAASIDVHQSCGEIISYLFGDPPPPQVEEASTSDSTRAKESAFFSKLDLSITLLWVVNILITCFFMPLVFWQATSIPTHLGWIGVIVAVISALQFVITETNYIRSRRISFSVYMGLNLAISIGMTTLLVLIWPYQITILRNLPLLPVIILVQLVLYSAIALFSQSLRQWLPSGLVFRFSQKWKFLIPLTIILLVLSFYLPGFAWRSSTDFQGGGSLSLGQKTRTRLGMDGTGVWTFSAVEGDAIQIFVTRYDDEPFEIHLEDPSGNLIEPETVNVDQRLYQVRPVRLSNPGIYKILVAGHSGAIYQIQGLRYDQHYQFNCDTSRTIDFGPEVPWIEFEFSGHAGQYIWLEISPPDIYLAFFIDVYTPSGELVTQYRGYKGMTALLYDVRLPVDGTYVVIAGYLPDGKITKPQSYTFDLRCSK